ncbi:MULTISPECIES: hypothetical protein [Sphingomonadaceae]|jgi:hypothetical protein|uniref:Uncharacterized protein n=1 Tax=Parasphingorhabdus flavimaris TaxID=266812 RepID=A0ABX2N3M6_9SPHN|nr:MULTISPECIES: hypothetical protein [Sphingomonadaceae]NVD28310.1 hypothetical protein [Parasphingorhabdus flavimaris]|tara:strand:+ start:165 stop:740 length:576 start_codon:yes stop_codon:yes gene_type:complete
MNYTIPVNPSDYQCGVNDILLAVENEFCASIATPCPGLNTLVMGGSRLTKEAEFDIAEYSFEQDWNIIYVAIDKSKYNSKHRLDDMKISFFDASGWGEATVYDDCRIWKEGALARLVLQTSEPLEMNVRINGDVEIRDGECSYHEHGFDLARKDLGKRTTRKQLSVPVIGTIGDANVIFDIQTLPKAWVTD